MSDVVQLFKALADETRLRILNLLSRRELCVCQIEEILGISQPKASRHLAYLRNAALVKDRREAFWIYYSLAEPEGRLHQRVLEWLREASAEIPQAAADLDALEEVGECSVLCSDDALSESTKRCKGAVTVES